MEFLNDIFSFLNDFKAFIHTGLYDFFVQWFAQFVIWSTVATLKFKIMMLTFSFDVASSILDQLNISALLDAAFSSLDSDVLNFITFLRIPEAIHIILSAKIMRYVMSFVGL